MMETLDKSRIFLSPPHLGAKEREYVESALATNWIAPVGPHLEGLEAEVRALTGVEAAVCISSGTAGLHLALRLLGVQAGDEVFCSTFTFVASANPILYQGAKPVFIDAEERSWNMDPELLAQALSDRAQAGKLPRAIIVADIYGQCADWSAILAVAEKYGVPVVEDAAESLGATYQGKAAGRFGAIGVYSFNGNKIVTTSGGGMILSSDAALMRRAMSLATQARESAAHYEHAELGYNYRLSNILAGIGRAQLEVLAERVERKRAIFAHYQQALSDLPGLRFMPELAEGRATRWLSCVEIDPQADGVDRDTLLASLAAANIEARPLWKPLHLQPLYRDTQHYGGHVSERLFQRGLCLPSGTAMGDEQLRRVVTAFRGVFRSSSVE